MLPADVVQQLESLVDEVERVAVVHEQVVRAAANIRSASCSGGRPLAIAVRRQRSAASWLRVSTKRRNQARNTSGRRSFVVSGSRSKSGGCPDVARHAAGRDTAPSAGPQGRAPAVHSPCGQDRQPGHQPEARFRIPKLRLVHFGARLPSLAQPDTALASTSGRSCSRPSTSLRASAPGGHPLPASGPPKPDRPATPPGRARDRPRTGRRCIRRPDQPRMVPVTGQYAVAHRARYIGNPMWGHRLSTA